MSERAFTESTVEEAAVGWLESVGWQVTHRPDVAPDVPAAERADYSEVVLAQRLRDGLARLMREAGHGPPTVSLRPGAVVVTFRLPEKTTGEATGKTTGKLIGKTPAAVWRLLTEDPTLSVPQLAARLKKSELTIHRAIRTLRESGRLVRIGPDKGGHWKVIE